MSLSPLGLPGINKVVAPKKIGSITLVRRDTEPKANSRQRKPRSHGVTFNLVEKLISKVVY
jgi:hypothetical protein